MIGKAIKLAEGHLDTHSKKVVMNKEFIRQIAKEVKSLLLLIHSLQILP